MSAAVVALIMGLLIAGIPMLIAYGVSSIVEKKKDK